MEAQLDVWMGFRGFEDTAFFLGVWFLWGRPELVLSFSGAWGFSWSFGRVSWAFLLVFSAWAVWWVLGLGRFLNFWHPLTFVGLNFLCVLSGFFGLLVWIAVFLDCLGVAMVLGMSSSLFAVFVFFGGDPYACLCFCHATFGPDQFGLPLLKKGHTHFVNP